MTTPGCAVSADREVGMYLYSGPIVDGGASAQRDHVSQIIRQ